MGESHDTRADAVERLQRARDQRATCSRQYESARGSAKELSASADLQVAEDQFAAREAWLEWIDRGH